MQRDHHACSQVHPRLLLTAIGIKGECQSPESGASHHLVGYDLSQNMHLLCGWFSPRESFLRSFL